MNENLLNLYFNCNPTQTDKGKKSVPASPCNITTEKPVADPSVDSKLKQDLGEIKDTFEAFRSKTQNVKSEVDKLDSFFSNNKDLTKAAFAAFSPIVPLRRISSAPDKIDNKDYAATAGLLAVAGILLPEDLRDMKDAVIQIFKGKLPKYNYKEFQTPFSFIRGSALESQVNKLGKYGYYLHKWDKSLIDTKFGKKIQELLKVRKMGKEFTGRKVHKIVDNEGKFELKEVKVYARKLEGSFIGKLICRALQRTTLYGTIALSVICIPSIINAFKKPENTEEKFINAGKQTIKSAVSVTSVLSGIGIVGALLASLGPAGSVIGMGIGSVIGAYISNKINKRIQKNN